MGALHSLEAAREGQRSGEMFAERVQQVIDALAHWRRLVVIELDGAAVSESELDRLHFELVQIGALMLEVESRALRMKEVREGGPWYPAK
jgi:hypothetical protein